MRSRNGPNPTALETFQEEMRTQTRTGTPHAGTGSSGAYTSGAGPLGRQPRPHLGLGLRPPAQRRRIYHGVYARPAALGMSSFKLRRWPCPPGLTGPLLLHLCRSREMISKALR